MRISWLDVATGAVLVGVIYLWFCIYQIATYTTNINEVMGVHPIKQSTVVPTDFDWKDPNKVYSLQRGDTLFVRIRARRFSDGSVYAQRLMLDVANRQFILSEIRRVFKKGGTEYIVAPYTIPIEAASGCGATLYSHTEYTISGNLLTRVAPIISEIQVAKICVE